jgi:hypothetical protein
LVGFLYLAVRMRCTYLREKLLRKRDVFILLIYYVKLII